MRAFWVTFEDGSSACCEGENALDAKKIAVHFTSKPVSIMKSKPGDYGINYDVKPLPHPASPCIYQHDHPVTGKRQKLCVSPSTCAGDLFCKRQPPCDK